MTAADRDWFYAERDRRTRAYNVATERLSTPVRIHVGVDAASSPAGQVLALSVINMVCRVHRRVELLLPDSDLLVVPLVPGRTLAEAGEALAVAIDPFIDLSSSRESAPTLAIGDVVGTYWLGADGYIGHLCDAPTLISGHPASLLGAGMAACLGSAALLLSVTGAPVRNRSVSLWGFDNQPVMSGPTEELGPIDVGELVALVGAGAVGSAILYWLRLLGVRGAWTVVDGDIVKLHNTNRSIGMLAADAGWGNGIPGGPAANKAEIGAALIGARPVVAWYDEWVKEPGPRLDLLIPAGGERNIRRNLGLLGLPLMIQGATSPDWQVQLHRHGPGDSCPAGRFRSEPTADMACSTGPLPVDSDPADQDESTDAALPFLSAAAGLLVVAAFTQLGHGYLAQPVNQHGLLFGAGAQVDWWNTITRCWPECNHRLSLGVRRKLNAGRRWSALDDQPEGRLVLRPDR
ncbi:MAG: ThiF family adenylyltransferase [Streptosporangiaceae bacterium]